MARFIYAEAVYHINAPDKVPKYNELPASAQYHWQNVAAQALETYWAQREFRETSTRRSIV